MRGLEVLLVFVEQDFKKNFSILSDYKGNAHLLFKKIENVKNPKNKIKATTNRCHLIISLKLNFDHLQWSFLKCGTIHIT